MSRFIVTSIAVGLSVLLLPTWAVQSLSVDSALAPNKIEVDGKFYREKTAGSYAKLKGQCNPATPDKVLQLHNPTDSKLACVNSDQTVSKTSISGVNMYDLESIPSASICTQSYC